MNLRSAFLLSGLLTASSGVAVAQITVFEDQFNSWDATKWSVYTGSSFLQRTQFGHAPVIGSESGVSFARFRLDTYNPDAAYRGSYLRGTQAFARPMFSLGSGMEFEARLRGRNLPRGIVFAFFTYSERGSWPTTYLKEEIDFEFLTNFNRNEMWLNIWDDWNPQRGGPNEASRTAASGLNWNNWNIYKIRWTNTGTEWYVNNALVRRTTNILPNDPMQLRLNIWAAASDWTTAYDGNLRPTTSASANQSYSMDVDWVRVRALPAPAGAFVGNGTGLAATYYNNMDFTGATLNRIDPQVKYDWGVYSPDPALGVDTFSARWTGKVQPQFSETYTFTVRADDGVRLWVNNQPLVNSWQDQAATEYSGRIALTAGQKYDIRLEYYENGGSAVAQLFWSSARTPKQLVPQIQLYPVDSTPPTVSISAPGSGWSYRSLASANGTAGDNEGVARVQVQLRDITRNLFWNGSAWTTTATNLTATGTTKWTRALPSLSDSRYSVTARAFDPAGNSVAVTREFFIDNLGPQITVSTPSPNSTYASLTAVTGTARDAGGGVSSVHGKLWRPSNNTAWNGSTWIAATSLSAAPERAAGGTANWTFSLPSLAAATYIFQPVARDYVGNVTYGTPVQFTISGAARLARTASSDTVLSDVVLSSAQASGADMILLFSGELGSEALNPALWQVAVNGEAVTVTSVSVTSGKMALRLAVKMATGDAIEVSWPQLRDAQGHRVPGHWRGKAR